MWLGIGLTCISAVVGGGFTAAMLTTRGIAKPVPGAQSRSDCNYWCDANTCYFYAGDWATNRYWTVTGKIPSIAYLVMKDYHPTQDGVIVSYEDGAFAKQSTFDSVALIHTSSRTKR